VASALASVLAPVLAVLGMELTLMQQHHAQGLWTYMAHRPGVDEGVVWSVVGW
jgi:hypothetical protein